MIKMKRNCLEQKGGEIDGGMKVINDGSKEMKDADKNKMTLR
jgi:hypothetical protein